MKTIILSFSKFNLNINIIILTKNKLNIIKSSSGPYIEDSGDPLPFNEFSVVDYSITSQSPQNTP